MSQAVPQALFPRTITLTEDDLAPRLITHNEVIGEIAKWAVVQHPYARPHGLFELCEAVAEASKAWPDGVPSLRMWRIDRWLELEHWLRPIFAAHWAPKEWNKPRSGHTQQIVASSRYWGPKPADDFIDIDALLRNVAMGVWRAAKDE